MKIEVITRTFEMIEKIQKIFKILYNENDKYKSIISTVRLELNSERRDELLKHMDSSFREEILEYLSYLGINKLKYRLNKLKIYQEQQIFNVNIPEEDLLKIEEIEDRYVLLYFIKVLESINYVSINGDKVLLKYNTLIYLAGWSKLHSLCRGIVVDINTKEILVHPFDKFFNFKEVDETSYDNVLDLIEHKKEIYLMDKLDGTTISITKMKNGEVLITTNGGYNNFHTKLAKGIIDNSSNYKSFTSELEQGFTYIFELVHHEDNHVIKYGLKEKLYLIGIRDIEANKLLTPDEVVLFADKYGLDKVILEKFKSISDLEDKMSTMTNANKEGWVLRIITNDKDVLIKFKLDEYVKVHKELFNSGGVASTYQLMLSGELDDCIAKLSKEGQAVANHKIRLINKVLDEIQAHLEISYSKILYNHNIKDDKEYRFIKTDKNNPKFKNFIEFHKDLVNYTEYYDQKGIKELLKGRDIVDIVHNIKVKDFKKICKKYKLINFEKEVGLKEF